jgi:replicative DNA helicase
MSRLGLQALISSLVDLDSLEVLAREGLAPECIPDDGLRGVVDYALDYYKRSGRAKAPTVDVMRERFGDLLDDREVGFDAEESIEWAIDDLRGTYVHRQAADFNKRFAVAMSEASVEERVQVVADAASEIVSLAQAMEAKDVAVDAREALSQVYLDYEERNARGDHIEGMTFGTGMERIDAHTLGIRPGEIAVVAATPKTGKSFFACRTALNAWNRGRVAVLYTLENSIEMTLNRIACMATGVDPHAWEKGECTDGEVERVLRWIAEMQDHEVPLHIVQPVEGRRTPEAIVMDSRMRGAEDVIVDQLTWVDHPDPKNKARHEVVRDLLRSFRNMVTDHRHKVPLMLIHQINREGEKAADKDGFLRMWHLAESSEVERAADWVFGLYQSRDERAALAMKFQTLASRRADLKHFLLTWRIWQGVVTVRQEIDLNE